MQPTPFYENLSTFNESFPSWEDEMGDTNWLDYLKTSCEISKYQGKDGSVKGYIDLVLSELNSLPYHLIIGYNDYIGDIKRMREAETITNTQAYLLLSLHTHIRLVQGKLSDII